MMQWIRGHMTTARTRRITATGTRVRASAVALAGTVLAVAAVGLAPAASAMASGNYNMVIPDRYDFHTWIWAVRSCGGNCMSVYALAQPIAKADDYTGQATLADGQYTLTVDDLFGLRCDNVYYGPTIPTHDVYTWDAIRLAGSMQSSFDTGCGGAPGGSFTYPFTLSRM
jgi:hypothetical protein